MYLFIYLLINLFIYLFILSCIRSFIHSIIIFFFLSFFLSLFIHPRWPRTVKCIIFYIYLRREEIFLIFFRQFVQLPAKNQPLLDYF